MKKVILFMNFFLILLLSTQISFSYTINDPIPDRIGNWAFEIYGIDVLKTPTNLTISLYTNYPQGGFTVGSWRTFAGDLAIDADNDGTFEYGFALTDHPVNPTGVLNPMAVTAGSLYQVDSWYVSDDYAPSFGGYIYNKDQIVTIQDGSLVGTTIFWGWVGLPGGPDWRIDVNLDPSLFSGLGEEIGLYWASATCANDYVEGSVPVPEPTTMLLLGSGLLGLAVCLRKKIKN
jgi:hypothetical protein